EANAVFDKLQFGEQVAVEVYRERDNKFGSRVHFVFERIAKAYDMRVRNVRGWIAAMTGRADLVTIGRNSVLVPWGTGPRDMSAAEFQGFWDDAKEVIETHIIPTLAEGDRDDVRTMVERA